MKKRNLLYTLFFSFFLLSCQQTERELVFYKMSDTPVEKVQLGGILGEYVQKSEEGRLSHFITDEKSPSIRLFKQEIAALEKDKNWQGEHAGKWLYAASRAAKKAGNITLEQHVKLVADFLISQQRGNGYLGTYSDSLRFYFKSETNQKSWDVWVNSYLITGLAEVYRQFGGDQYLESAKKIGDLFIETFQHTNKMIAHSSYHHGMVGIGSMGAFIDLFELTQEQKYLDFARYCADEVEQRKGLELISRAIEGYDVNEIGNGKIYEMLRVLTGISRLYAYTGDQQLLKACELAWANIKTRHLSPAGGPWGGVGKGHHLECFNVGFSFSPYGYVETCSSMAWMQFNSVMLKITADSKYADQLEKTAYNSLLAKLFPDGEHWVYHSRPNGVIHQTGETACCSSSGAVALEEIAPVMYTRYLDKVYVNIFGSSSMEYNHTTGGTVRIVQETKYPYDGFVKLKFETDDKRYVDLHIRIPVWAEKASVTVGGVKYKAVPGEYARVTKKWNAGDEVEIILPMRPFIHKATRSYDDKGYYLNSETIFFNFQYGALSLATSLCDTDENQTQLVFKGQDPYSYLKFVSPPGEVPTFTFDGIADTTLVFKPYFLVGDMTENACRTSWVRWAK